MICTFSIVNLHLTRVSVIQSGIEICASSPAHVYMDIFVVHWWIIFQAPRFGLLIGIRLLLCSLGLLQYENSQHLVGLKYMFGLLALHSAMSCILHPHVFAYCSHLRVNMPNLRQQ